jgi:hypothetical protein
MFARSDRLQAAVGEMERLHDAASLMRSHPEYEIPTWVREHVREVLRTGRLTILDDPRPN